METLGRECVVAFRYKAKWQGIRQAFAVPRATNHFCLSAALMARSYTQTFCVRIGNQNMDTLLVHNEGFLESNGTMFHSSRLHGDNNPVCFTLGTREVLKVWDKVMQNMCTGEKRKLTIPPPLAMGRKEKARSHRAAHWFLTLSLWRSGTVPGHMSPSRRWISTRTESCPDKVKEYLMKQFEKHGYQANTHHEFMVDYIFNMEDEDKDGFITTREFTYTHNEL
ncbi:Peptidyl-prolyl cis-trans isomerase FKBP14 [Merluccius polli]|uniref:peptidylprolyl isomerase n=1 Tax=Merluccius polli TaxID=89951 RepID=A0AA47M0J0_MERPO|nr:Peptidyl-prolyl cis-trans isomerase FKBP14 [Merluccius polli]